MHGPDLPSDPAARRGKGRRPRPDQDDPVTRHRAGAATRSGRTAGPAGPFTLAPGLAGPGSLDVADAVTLVCADLVRQGRDGTLDLATAESAEVYARRVQRYARLKGAVMLSDVDRDVCELYIHSPNAPGYGTVNADGRPGKASLGTKHSRRTYLRMFFKTCRALGLDDRDPTADIVLPPRQARWVRPLTDDEVVRCKDSSHKTIDETRLPCGLALALAGTGTGELPNITTVDVHLDAQRVWVHGGGTRALARWVALDGWGTEMVGRRLDWLAVNPRTPQEIATPHRHLVYAQRKAEIDKHKRQAAGTMLVSEVLRLAGLRDVPGVRPSSVQEHFARRVYDETGSVEHVAARLGMASLDAAAHLVGLDWRALYDLDGPPGVEPPRHPEDARTDAHDTDDRGAA